jgi:hypothetical protein
MFPNVVNAARGGPDRWYVKSGEDSVGPIKLDLLARGVAAGMVPSDALVRHEGWQVWCPVSDLADVAPSQPRADAAAGSTFPIESPTLSLQSPISTDDILEIPRPSTSKDFLPTDAIDGAATWKDALNLLMTAAVTRSRADAALVHEVNGEQAVVVCAHGPAATTVLGTQTPLFDAALVAAAAGAIVIAEPTPGPAGLSILDRMARVAGPLDGAVMLPIRPRSRLAAVLELGRLAPFRPAEIAALEALTQALVAKHDVWELD